MTSFKTSGTCAREIKFEIENNIIKEVEFISGCPGNLLGIQHLVKDKNVDDIITQLKGITCGSKSTSCPDQLAIALQEYKEAH